MTSYENFVTNYHRYQYAPRTLSEAFRDADYGTAIWRCEKPHQWRTDVVMESLTLMVVCGLIGYFLAIIVG